MFFDKELRWLSNFIGAISFTRGGVQHHAPTVEHAYQAFKTTNSEDFEKVLACHTPGQAKRMGRTIEVRPDWDEVKIPVMKRLVELKFRQSDELAGKLIDLDGDIIEGNWWHDQFWGSCNCPSHAKVDGQNHLGIILMELRDQLRHEQVVYETTGG